MIHFFLRHFLAFFAKIIIKFHKPCIIWITGTAGKTTISRFVITFLQENFWEKSVEFSRYNYNWEFGLPLAIIGTKSEWKNIFRWLKIPFITLKKIFTKYPDFLVLEYGIDHPGEMDFLSKIAKPNIVIFTPIVANHIEQFGNFEAYRDEKLKLIPVSEKNFLHYSLSEFKNENSIIYGNSENIDFSLSDTVITPNWTKSWLLYKNQNFSFFLPSFGVFQAENILPIFALAKELDIDFEKVINICPKFTPEIGRSRIFEEKNFILVDWTYNWWLLANLEWIRSISSFVNDYEIILFLGDMRELGELTESKHLELVDEINNIFSQNKEKIHIFLVGESMKNFCLQKLEKNFDTKHSFSSKIMGQEINNLLDKNPNKKFIIFAKWSQNTIFLEEWLKQFLSEKFYTNLTRQSPEWLVKKENFFESIEK